MKAKLISGILCLIIGIGLLICGFYGKQRMGEARKQIASTQPPKTIIPKNPLTDRITKDVTKSVKEKYYRQVDEYELPVMLCFVGGGIFTVLGIVLVALSRKK